MTPANSSFAPSHLGASLEGTYLQLGTVSETKPSLLRFDGAPSMAASRCRCTMSNTESSLDRIVSAILESASTSPAAFQATSFLDDKVGILSEASST